MSNFVAKKVFASNDMYYTNAQRHNQDNSTTNLRSWLGNPEEMDYSIHKCEDRSALGKADVSGYHKSTTNLNDSSSSLIYAEDDRSRCRHRLDSQRETSYGDQYINNTQGLYASRSQPYDGDRLDGRGRPARDRSPVLADTSLNKAETFLADFNRKIAAMNLNKK